MIKLEKEDLQVLERASEIVEKLRKTSKEKEEMVDLFFIELNIDCIILKQSTLKKKRW
jgi:hypothetical protein